ncbi:MAG: FAD-binding protein [Pseudomonadales bacterium]|nr:FAD-binding protein [Pseudomonadales bacterium]
MSQLYDPNLDGDVTVVDKDLLVSRLHQYMSTDLVLTVLEDKKPFECDGLSAYCTVPLIVVIPETVSQVQSVLRTCYEMRVPVVTRGSGTGLSSGALPFEQGVLLVMTKLNRIIEIDINNRIARVEPGIANLAVSEAVAEYGFYYAPDPSSQIACSIGGNVSENAGGVHCLKYGLTVHNVLSMEVLSVSGERYTVGTDALDAPGFDLLALLIGSEGMLGIVVEITVKLLPKPPQAKALLAAFDDVKKGGEAVAAIIAAGVIPGGLEMMDKIAIQAVEDFIHAGYPKDAAAILLCELDGDDATVAAELETVTAVLKRSGAIEVRVAKDEAERLLFWAGRKSAFPAVGRISPDYYCIDGTIPRRELANVLQKMQDYSEHYQLAVANVFHAGDGNLHPLILFDANIPGEFDRVEEMGARILELCIAVGGTITGEHGVGREKLNQMAVQFSDVEIVQFHSIKNAFDTNGLLNPGKGIPTLARCREYRVLKSRRVDLDG